MTPTREGSEPFDFFQAGELPAPTLSTAEATSIVAAEFGLAVVLEPLGSQQDQNFAVRDAAEATAGPSGILKISNPAFSSDEIAVQDAASARVAERHPQLRVGALFEQGGRALTTDAATSQGVLNLRILRFLDGGTLSGPRYLAADVVAAMGELAARVSVSLADFEHPGLGRSLQWDLRSAERVVAELGEHQRDAARRERVARATAREAAVIARLTADLPVQPGHFDLTDDNVIVGPDGRRPDGLIDFGDVSRSWAVAELAVTLSSILHHDQAEPHHVIPAVRAFHAIRPLAEAELAALWPLVVLRGAALVVSGEHQIRVDAGNDYASSAIEHEWSIFAAADSVPSAVMTALLRDALGMSAAAPARPALSTILALDPASTARPALSTILSLDPATTVRLDLATVADAADEGAWMRHDLADRLAADHLAAGSSAVVAPFGLARVSEAQELAAISPASVATGVSLWLAEETRLRVGEIDAALPAGHRLDIQIVTGDVDEVPPLVRPEYAAGWLAQVADPSALLGMTGERKPEPEPGPSTPTASAPAHDLLARRTAHYAEVQEHYYAAPPQIERGWRHHLLDTDGRAYLDMVNNVTAVGHAHPRIATAVDRQLRTLNTNSRFHYDAVVEFSEALAATLPDPLDTVFLVNSGSEAVDLALRVAMAATGRRDVVAVREAYHGWTLASDAVSTSAADNPDAAATRPDWVHTVEAPNSYRGSLRGAEAAGYARDAAARIAELAASGRAPAAFLAEPFYGTAGGIALPGGYLDEVYRAVRRAGGLAIADEVQVGYGRLGEWFWGFEQQGVVPDIVAVAKSIGNGHPLGAVVTTREIAARFRSQGYFFSSTGGSPVSSVVGLEVLDILRTERLPENAAAVGAHLIRRLTELAERHPLIGALHGAGLYVGVELVRDRATLEPADTETAAICERMLTLGVIVQPTGEHGNLLKVKPPLCIDERAADYFVDTLDRVLATGW